MISELESHLYLFALSMFLCRRWPLFALSVLCIEFCGPICLLMTKRHTSSLIHNFYVGTVSGDSALDSKGVSNFLFSESYAIICVYILSIVDR